MPIYRLGRALAFPPPEGASPEGIVAVGGDTSPERLLLAYSVGIFPWPTRGMPLLWFSPDPRFVLEARRAHVPKSLKKRMRSGVYEVRFDTAFEQVIDGCAAAPRPGQDGTWITRELRNGYTELHRLGFAHSIEAWRGDELVGGLYGLSLGGAFFGESMFATAPDASKVAFVTLLANLATWGIELVDCQVHTEHLARFGAQDWPRARFLERLHAELEKETRRGPWTVEVSAAEASRAFADRAD